MVSNRLKLIEDPPLPPRRAILLAQSELEKLVSDADKWTFHGLLPPGVLDGSPPKMSIVVLMNGNVIQPTRSPWSPK